MSEINVPNSLNWRPYPAYTCNCENQSIVKNKLVDNKKCPRTTAICGLNIFINSPSSWDSTNDFCQEMGYTLSSTLSKFQNLNQTFS